MTTTRPFGLFLLGLELSFALSSEARAGDAPANLEFSLDPNGTRGAALPKGGGSTSDPETREITIPFGAIVPVHSEQTAVLEPQRP